MEQDIFDQTIKNALKEKAPSGFTDQIMKKLEIEKQTQLAISPAKLPGKVFLILAIGFFGLVLFLAFYFNNAVGSSNLVLNYFDQLLSKVHFHVGASEKILAFSIASIFGFLVLDFFLRTKKIVHV